MSSGAYVALSGLQARAEQLNRLAGDLANIGTAGYKAERGTTAAAERPADAFGNALKSAIDVAEGPRSIDMHAGVVTTTGRDLDLAIDGRGFFVIDTPEGVRYTRNGHFTRRADNVLATGAGGCGDRRKRANHSAPGGRRDPHRRWRPDHERRHAGREASDRGLRPLRRLEPAGRCAVPRRWGQRRRARGRCAGRAPRRALPRAGERRRADAVDRGGRAASLRAPSRPGSGRRARPRRAPRVVGGVRRARRGTRVPVTRDTRFQVASVSKAVSAFGLLRLAAARG